MCSRGERSRWSNSWSLNRGGGIVIEIVDLFLKIGRNFPGLRVSLDGLPLFVPRWSASKVSWHQGGVIFTMLMSI